MTATDLIYPIISAIVPFLVALAVILLGFSMLHMIGKTN